ncbi:hypothetical protein EDD29_8982 [Actinocorallia herbida]|uniref:Uncharacterized protein n=1 Tax=Actinocorallia herbida TaxID=58109 RepID=A0A3N1DCJ2_9ACTN|nr:hypothetical protein [Actinocorallia herbida]ROO91230.1 hypothetical protein EDD29_8982 [Actinocorallia herbida]
MAAARRARSFRRWSWRRWAAVAAAVPLVAAGGFAGGVRADLVPRPLGWPEALSPPILDARGCPTGVGDAQIDWVPFLWFDGRQYTAWGPEGKLELVEPGRVSGALGEITCSVPSTGSADLAMEPHPYPDGSAPFVPVGTPVHGLRGLPVKCAVAMELHGKMTVYHAIAENADRPKEGCSRNRVS